MIGPLQNNSKHRLIEKRGLEMDFSASSLIAGFLFSIVGWWIYREGKKNTNVTIVIIGILLMTFTIFTRTPFATWGSGLGLCGAAYYFWNR